MTGFSGTTRVPSGSAQWICVTTSLPSFMIPSTVARIGFGMALLRGLAVRHCISEVLLGELGSLLRKQIGGVQSPGLLPQSELTLVNVGRLQFVSWRIEQLRIDRANRYRGSHLLVCRDDRARGIAEYPDRLQQGASKRRGSPVPGVAVRRAEDDRIETKDRFTAGEFAVAKGLLSRGGKQAVRLRGGLDRGTSLLVAIGNRIGRVSIQEWARIDPPVRLHVHDRAGVPGRRSMPRIIGSLVGGESEYPRAIGVESIRGAAGELPAMPVDGGVSRAAREVVRAHNGEGRNWSCCPHPRLQDDA